MASPTQFLQPTNSTVNPNPNQVTNSLDLLTYNYSQNPSSVSVQTVTNVLIQGGLASAVLKFEATAIVDPAFSEILSETIVKLEGGASEGTSQIESKVVGIFDIAAQTTFSFSFSSSLELTAKEIENSNIEYSQAKSEGSFLVLDISNLNSPTVIDYFAFDGQLISSKKLGNMRDSYSDNFTFIDRYEDIDIDGNNEIDFVTGTAIGTYEKQFTNSTKVAVVEINTTSIKSIADYLINNLGTDVTYGTIWNNNLVGGVNGDKIYASLGNDLVWGVWGNDTLEGGGGNDWLHGGHGNDRINGGYGNDTIADGLGSDTMYGGENADRFVFTNLLSLRSGEFNIVADFQAGVDRVTFLGWRTDQISNLLVDTPDGAIFTSQLGGKVLFEDVDKNTIINSYNLS
jgi:serralysin